MVLCVLWDADHCFRVTQCSQRTPKSYAMTQGPANSLAREGPEAPFLTIGDAVKKSRLSLAGAHHNGQTDLADVAPFIFFG